MNYEDRGRVMSFLKKGQSGAQNEKKIKERKANEGKQLLTQFFKKKGELRMHHRALTLF